IMLLLAVTVSVTSAFFAAGVLCLPLMDQGPYIDHGWDQVVRLRHLYAMRPGLHLLIGADGQIHGSAEQSVHSLLEIRPVDPGCVAIRGVASSRFLCIEGDGTLYSQSYNRDDCSFKEQILPDGYNVYTSDKHRVLLSLGNQRQRLQGRDRGVPALAQFLPRINTVPEALISGLGVPEQPRPGAAQTEENMDNVDSFGKLSQIIHSPSFHER
uniref:Fibroblast growth factor n=1 Tax=Cynoglossus semilaevis TaxID=244447 RepID=A0A3P8VCS1_CYNSE